MMLESLLNRGSLPVLQQVMSFTEARHNVLANNVSNFDTVGYKMQDLPEAEFFAELDRAVQRRNGGGAGAPLEMRSTKNMSWDDQGRIEASAVEIEGSNILFHDENNRFVEKQMSAMAENGLRHNIASELLRQQYNLLRRAIRGRRL